MNHYKPKRHSIRLTNYDYSSVGAYSVTICIHRRVCLLGTILNGEIMLNEYGRIVEECWNNLADNYSNVATGEFVIMPNHIHGIIIITDLEQQYPVRTIHELSDNNGTIHELSPIGNMSIGDRLIHAPKTSDSSLPLHIQRRKMMVPKIIGRFKMNSAKNINAIRKTNGTPVWQKNYYEHVIRNQEDYMKVAEYIHFNPLQWEHDSENPEYMPDKS